MILTSNKALEILEGARGKTLSDGWINHSICVGESAYKIAKALNEKGQAHTVQAEGLLAVCIQHELDHLLGKVFVEYLSPLKRNRIKTKMVKQQRGNRE